MSASTINYPVVDLWNTDSVFAQLPNDKTIQIINTSTFTDDLENFHVIGEIIPHLILKLIF